MTAWQAKFGLSWLTVLWATAGMYFFILGLTAAAAGDVVAGGLAAIVGFLVLMLWLYWFLCGRDPHRRSPWSL